MSNKISAYTDDTIIPFGKHQGKHLYQVSIDYLRWYYDRNRGWWRHMKSTRNRLDMITADPITQYKYLMMEYIEENLDVE